MDDAKLVKIYLNVYLWLFVLVQTLLLWLGSELASPRGIMNTAFTYLSFVPLFGYIYDKKIPTRGLWRLFIVLFFLWQIASFAFLYPLPVHIKGLQILMMMPLYWSLAGYAIITVQQDEAKKAAIIQKRDDFKERSKTIVSIICSLAMLLLILCIIQSFLYYQKIQELTQM